MEENKQAITIKKNLIQEFLKSKNGLIRTKRAVQTDNWKNFKITPSKKGKHDLKKDKPSFKSFEDFFDKNPQSIMVGLESFFNVEILDTKDKESVKVLIMTSNL